MKRISREWLMPVVVSISVILANSWHIFSEWGKHKPGELFTGIAHYFADYFLYISQIVQGQRGAWVFTSPMFTNEPSSPTWIYWLYTLIGKLVTVFRISPFFAYSVSLVVFAAIVLALWWRVSGRVFPKQPVTRLIAFLFLAAASHIPGLGEFWFSPMPSLNRLGGVPHQMFQTILLLSVILLFTADKTRMVLLAGTSFLAATANPIQMLLLVVSMAVCVAIDVGKNGVAAKTPNRPRHLLRWVTIAAPALLGALLTNAEFARQPILTAAKLWEDSQRVSVPVWQLVLAVGPIAAFIPFGIRQFISGNHPICTILFLYGAASFFMFLSPLPALFGTSPVRWLSPASYGILPLVAAVGLNEVATLLHRSIRVLPVSGIRVLLLTVFVVFTLPSLQSQVAGRLTPLSTDETVRSLNHIAYPVLDGLTAVFRDPGRGVVLTDPTLPYDVLMPVFGKRSFTGHPIHTLYPQEKDRLRTAFFSGTMDEKNAAQFFRDHDISMVFASANAAKVLRPYPFLSVVLQNDVVAVYTLQ